MKQQRTRWIWAALAAVGLALAGCGDSNVFSGSSSDSGSSAKNEEGVAAINDKNWDKAITIYEQLNQSDPTPENRKYLASAYVGKSGFDTLKLTEQIAQNQESDVPESVVYDSVTTIFDTDGDGVISKAELDEKIAWLGKAIKVFHPSYENGAVGKVGILETADPVLTDDEIFQAGICAALHAVLSVVGQLVDPGVVDPGDPTQLLLTLVRLQAALAADPTFLTRVVAPDTLNADLALVDAARDILLRGLVDNEADSNKIANEFEKFLTDVGYLPEGQVTSEELRLYLNSLLASLQGGN